MSVTSDKTIAAWVRQTILEKTFAFPYINSTCGPPVTLTFPSLIFARTFNNITILNRRVEVFDFTPTTKNSTAPMQFDSTKRLNTFVFVRVMETLVYSFK